MHTLQGQEVVLLATISDLRLLKAVRGAVQYGQVVFSWLLGDPCLCLHACHGGIFCRRDASDGCHPSYSVACRAAFVACTVCVLEGGRCRASCNHLERKVVLRCCLMHWNIGYGRFWIDVFVRTPWRCNWWQVVCDTCYRSKIKKDVNRRHRHLLIICPIWFCTGNMCDKSSKQLAHQTGLVMKGLSVTVV